MSIPYLGDAGPVMDFIVYCLTLTLINYLFRRQLPVNDSAFHLCFIVFALIYCINDLYLIIKSPWSIVLVFARLYFIRLMVDMGERRITQTLLPGLNSTVDRLTALSEAQETAIHEAQVILEAQRRVFRIVQEMADQRAQDDNPVQHASIRAL